MKPNRPKVTAVAVPTSIAYRGAAEIAAIHYAACQLEVTVAGCYGEADCVVTFVDPVGFRVLDERDLNEYWPVCSTPNGWLFEITAHGWLSEESAHRPISAFFPNAREYLVAGGMECVSVISTQPPTLYAKSP